MLTFLIPIRFRQAYAKHVCLWDLAQIIYITFIIQVARAIWFLVDILLQQSKRIKAQ